MHSVLFWAGNVMLTPLILLVTLFSDRKRTLHDLLLGTVVTARRPLNSFLPDKPRTQRVDGSQIAESRANWQRTSTTIQSC